MYATFKHPVTGEMRNLKIGFSWTVLFFAGAFGIPLWIRRLHIPATIMCVLWLGGFILQAQIETARTYDTRDTAIAALLMLAIGQFVYQLYLAFNANEMAAKNYLREGWKFADENSEISRHARMQWRMQANNQQATSV